MFDSAYTLTSEAARVIISVNPKAGAGPVAQQIEQLVQELNKRQLHCDVLTDLDEVAARANRLYDEGLLRALVGVGGDGTAAELVNRTKPGVPITVLPAGTENLLSKYLGLIQPVDELADTIDSGHVVLLDTGKANGRLFLLMIGCGFDADVVHRVHDRRKGHITHLTWIKPIVQTIRSYRYPEIRVYCDEQNDSDLITVRWLFAFNLPCYGGGLKFAPEAKGTDGLLDICAFKGGSLLHGLRYTVNVLLGRHHKMSDCVTTKARRIRVTSEDKVPFQLDGDPGGFLPVDIEVVPQRLAVLVPAGRINK